MPSTDNTLRFAALLAALVALATAIVIGLRRPGAVDSALRTVGDTSQAKPEAAPLQVKAPEHAASEEPRREQRTESVPGSAGRFLTGSVRSTLGVAIRGAAVEGRAAAVVRSTRTDAQGAFRLGPFPDGDVELRVAHPEFFGIGRRCSASRRRLDVRLEALGVIFGQVRGVPAGDRSVHLRLEVSAGDDTGPWRVLEPRVPVREGGFHVGVRTRRFVRLVLLGPEGPVATSEPLRVEAGRRNGPVILQ